ncbi:prolipoprotein diacylglyceryl transferase [Candidatus Beckwithbacteria bacterium]|nr:prolipoprotein diacylglyceryl transferase [Candidatus Beckwithbacteria bacterium]
MFPVLLALGPITISSLGFCIVLAFIFGSFLFWRKAKEEHLEDQDIFDLIFLCFFGGLVGSRLTYILLNFTDFGFNLGKWINLGFNNHFSWLGFLFGMMIMAKLITDKKKLDWFFVLDLATFSFIISQIIFRLGQFLDGSYLGLATDLPFGIYVPGLEVKTHPVAIYEIILLIMTYFLIKWFDNQYRLFTWYQDARGKANPGFLFLTYLLMFALIDFSLDFFMPQTWRLFIFSQNQMVLFFFMILVILGFYSRTGKDIVPKFLTGIFSKKEELEPIRPAVSSPDQVLTENHRRIRRFERNK